VALVITKEMPARADGKAAIRWTPRTAGTQTLFVKTVDRAGNLSDLRRYEFIVLAGGHPTAHWALDGTLTDTNGGNALTPNGNPNLAAAGYSRAVPSTVDAITLSSSLYYDQDNKCWAFGMTAAGNKDDLKVAYSLREAQADVWTHLAGTYGSTTKTRSRGFCVGSGAGHPHGPL
jgi:hypothetical protein